MFEGLDDLVKALMDIDRSFKKVYDFKHKIERYIADKYFEKLKETKIDFKEELLLEKVEYGGDSFEVRATISENGLSVLGFGKNRLAERLLPEDLKAPISEYYMDSIAEAYCLVKHRERIARWIKELSEKYRWKHKALEDLFDELNRIFGPYIVAEEL